MTITNIQFLLQMEDHKKRIISSFTNIRVKPRFLPKINLTDSIFEIPAGRQSAEVHLFLKTLIN